MKWYDLLIADEYAEFFNTLPIDRNDKRFSAYREIVSGITCANNGIGSDSRRDWLDHYRPMERASALYFQSARQGAAVNFGQLFQSGIDDYSRNHWERLSDEQLAVQILYPFWSRMGGSFEIPFAESGKLGRTILELRKRAGENRA